MTTQGNHPSGDVADHVGTAPAPETGETASPSSPSPAAPAADDSGGVTAAGGESQELTGSPSESPAADTSQEQLVSREAAMDFKARWEAIQQGFVDDPRSAVSDADSLVTDVLHQLSAGFEEQHRQLEGQWSEGEPDTERLRSALQRYRDFFDRLLTI